MDKELRKEVREWKAEVDDRLKRLEDAQKATDAQSVDTAPVDTKTKKTATEPTSGEKEAN